MELTENGYEAMSLPRVADRANVHASTVHRRWPTKASLILDLGTELTSAMVPDPACESVRADLLALAESVATMLREPAVVMVLRAAFVLPEESLVQLRETFWATRIVTAQQIVDRAIERGELHAAVTAWELIEPIHAVVWMRLLITGREIDAAAIEALVDRTLNTLAPSPAAHG